MKGLLKIRARAQVSELLIFGDIGDLGFEGTVKAKDIVTQLAGLKTDTLLVRINSYGGRVDEGLAIYNALRAFSGTVTTRVEGMAASIASVIALAGTRVEMARGSMMMIHAASSFAGGNADDLKSAAQSLDKTDQTLAEIYARKTGRTAEDELDLIKSTGDRWMTAEEAVEQGYADAIFDPDEQTAKAAVPAYCDGLRHYLPTAGAFAGVVTAHLARISAAVVAPDPKFAVGDRVTIAQPHDPAHRTGQISIVSSEPLYGVLVEGMEDMGIHRWYAESELSAGAAAGGMSDGMTASARIARIRLPSAARAAATPTETCMNWKTLAQALGIKLADGADDSAARLAIAKHFALTDTATDDEIATAIAAAGNDGSAAAATPATAATARAGADARRTQIEELFAIAMQGRQDRAALTAMRAQALIGTDSVDDVRERLVAHLAGGAPVQGSAAISTAQAGTDQREKTRAAAVNWLMARAGVLRGEDQRRATESNPFLRMNFHDIARACLADAGVDTRRMNRMDIITAAITHSTSDFPNIFENALNKTLLRGFELQKPTWNRFCKTGSLSDFRPHIRYRAGSIGDLQVRKENGEYKSLTLGDAERETITAQSRGGILNLTREMLVNDDMSVFTDVAMMLGTSAARTLDKAVFALFALNAGNGPTMGDGKALFHADHGNIAGTAAAPTVDSVEALRVQMASQKDPGGNDYVDLRPSIWLGPLSVGGKARVVNNSTYDPDTANKLQRPNIVANLYSDIVDTPRLSGTAWYSLCDPNVDPVFEVGFLDGVSTPQIEQKEAWTQAGMSWRVLYEFGVAAIGWRGIVRNAGA